MAKRRGEPWGREQLSRKICLLVGFAADVGRCNVERISTAKISWAHPSKHSLFDWPQDGSAFLEKDPQPRRLPQHREVDSAKTKTRQKNIDAIPHMLVVQRRNCLSQSVRAVGLGPAV